MNLGGSAFAFPRFLMVVWGPDLKKVSDMGTVSGLSLWPRCEKVDRML